MGHNSDHCLDVYSFFLHALLNGLLSKAWNVGRNGLNIEDRQERLKVTPLTLQLGITLDKPV